MIVGGFENREKAKAAADRIAGKVQGVKCVIVSEALQGVEPMAWDFVMNFARDNHLQVAKACLIPELRQGN